MQRIALQSFGAKRFRNDGQSSTPRSDTVDESGRRQQWHGRGHGPAFLATARAKRSIGQFVNHLRFAQCGRAQRRTGTMFQRIESNLRRHTAEGNMGNERYINRIIRV